MPLNRLRDESGFTLTELLVAATAGIVVLFAVLALLDSSLRLSAKTADRVETTARVRLAMDLITRQIRSQVCLGQGDPALVEATPTSVTFYASLGPESPTLSIQKRSLTYDAASKTITEKVWEGTGTRPNITFPALPTKDGVLVTGVEQIASTPIFRYLRFQVQGAGTPARPRAITTATALPLADRERTVQVEISFAGIGERPDTRVELFNSAYVHTSNPAFPETSPTCI